MKSKMMIISMVIVIFIAATSFTFFQPKPWPVPDKNSKMANPVKSDEASLKTGKAVWSKDCASCHGKSGKGDGTKSASLKTPPGDFTSAAVKAETDGTLFYRISEGRGDMPSFKKKLPDAEELWSVINYMRTFK